MDPVSMISPVPVRAPRMSRSGVTGSTSALVVAWPLLTLRLIVLS